MSHSNHRQDPPGADNVVISGTTGHLQFNIPNVSNVQGIHPSRSARDLDDVRRLFEELLDLLELHSRELANPGAVMQDLLYLHTELRRDEPELGYARQLLERIAEAVRRVDPLAELVYQLTQLISGGMFDRSTDRSQPPAIDPLPVTIYLSDEGTSHDVQAAVEELLGHAGLAVIDREDPVLGSWFRRMRATISRAAGSQVVRESALTAAHVADARLVLAQDATITATMMQNVGPVLASLQPTKDAVVRLGAVLIVKVDWEVRVIQLTAAQQAVLDHQPQLATSPRDVIGAIGLLATSEGQTAAGPTPQAAGDR
ncbi:hypothetical protein [Streptomyces sp. NPDC015414]|uniref:hypothetical protein n=1 Tax=Streptomyces sp. NPDC015414 TaxID=3364957 RepID=UPI0036F7A418